ncbi:MAG: chromosomal replication initiator protein DnaA [Spirochaetales bacterium]
MSTWNYIDFWKEALIQIKSDFSNNNRLQEFDMWLSSVNYEEAKENSITVAIPSQFLKDQFISRNYDSVLKNKLEELTGKKFDISYIIKKTTVSNISEENISSEAEKKESKNISVVKEKSPLKEHPDLNSKYTFDSFITGDNNSFAYNAALSVSKNPGKSYNPVLFYGGVGLGKTHLMQAIGNNLHEQNSFNIIYITAENFTNEFISSINEKQPQKFKNKYRSTDVLLIDDIHFLQKKEATQEELFHIFNALYNANKQIVFTCDRPIFELKNITDRLKSRFERGLNIDLLPPRYETRVAILQKKLEYLKYQFPPNVSENIPEEAINIIAQNIETNVRDLESCLTKITAYAELTGLKITTDIVYQLLKDKFSSPEQGNISVDIIQRIVAEEYNVSVSDIKGKKRTKNIILPRQIAMYLSHTLTDYSTTEIGIEFGGKDHTTVMHACKKAKELIKLDSKLDKRIENLIKTIKDFKK